MSHLLCLGHVPVVGIWLVQKLLSVANVEKNYKNTHKAPPHECFLEVTLRNSYVFFKVHYYLVMDCDNTAFVMVKPGP
jgi:hypothetical protein